MGPSPAEVARTLARGRLPGTLRIAGQEPVPVCHSTDAAGRPLVLVRDGDRLSQALSSSSGQHDPRVVLTVDDVPPVAGAPSLGRAGIAGRVHRLDAADAAATVHELAEANPATDLLDVGRDVAMHLIEVDGVRLDRRPGTTDIPVAEYTMAEPDPLHELERDLLLDLAHHHATQVEQYFRFLLAVAGIPCCRTPPRAVRLDRYGFIVDLGEGPGVAGTDRQAVRDPVRDTARDAARRWARLGFHRPVHCRHELAQLLHPVLFHRSRCARDYPPDRE